MSIKLLFNQCLIAGCAIATNLYNRLKKTHGDEKIVLIVFHQIFGDAIVFSNSLKGYTDLFARRMGYKILLVARPSIIKFMRDTIFIPKDIEIEIVDFKRFLEDFSYYKIIRRKYYNLADTIIVPGTSLSGEIFSVACNAKRRIGLVSSIPVKWPPIMALFQKLAYTETIWPEKDMMMLQRHRLLLNYLGLHEYKAKLPQLLPQENIVNEERYCVICPGASKTEKCWPIERFIEIINYLIDRYSMEVHLCGGVDEVRFEEIILNAVKNPSRVHSHIGRTTFSEWSAIVQHAGLVLGNDSATMHLAAASGRKAICIAGVYDKFQFFPYKVDCLGIGERLPTTILHDMPCAWCRTRGYFSGYQNAKCKKQIEEGKCTLCIDEITVNQVIEEIDYELKELSNNEYMF